MLPPHQKKPNIYIVHFHKIYMFTILDSSLKSYINTQITPAGSHIS